MPALRGHRTATGGSRTQERVGHYKNYPKKDPRFLRGSLHKKFIYMMNHDAALDSSDGVLNVMTSIYSRTALL